MNSIKVADGAENTLSTIRNTFEAQTIEGGVRGALASRAYEQVLRVAGA